MSPNLIDYRMNTSCAPAFSEQQIEAARYAVLRRLSPALRHHMVRYLQPIGLIYGVMAHRLSRGEPDVSALRVHADKMNEFAKAALAQCIDSGTWLAPESGAWVALEAGILECVGLLATTLHFRGFRLVNDVENLPCQVRQGALRMVLMAVLLELSDTLDQPANLSLSASVNANANANEQSVTLQLQVTPRKEGRVEMYEDGYRKLTWRDVQALAGAEAVKLSREEGRVTMCFPVKDSMKDEFLVPRASGMIPG